MSKRTVIKHLEIEVFQAVLDKFSSQKLKKTFVSGINSKNFFGGEIDGSLSGLPSHSMRGLQDS